MCAYFDLDHVLAVQAEVVHLMIRIVCITTTLVLDKGEAVMGVSIIRPSLPKGEYIQSARRRSRCWNVAANQASITLEFVSEVTSSSTMTEASHIERSSTAARHGRCK